MKYSLPNEKTEVRKEVEVYKPFPGKNTEQMPLLLGEGRSPLWITRFMRRRIDHSCELPDLRDYADMGDLIGYDSNKRSTDVKLILTVDNKGRITENGRKALELITPGAELTPDYAVSLGEIYDTLNGITVPGSEIGILGKHLENDKILESKVWRILARHPSEVPAEFAEDPDLLKEYAAWVKTQTKQGTNMGIGLDQNSEDAKLRALCVYGLGVRSRLSGWNDLNYDFGRLVGYMASETPSSAQPDRENEAVRAYTPADVQNAKRQLEELEKFVRLESIEGVKSLIQRL